MVKKEKEKKIKEAVKIVSVHLPVSLHSMIQEIGKVNAVSVHSLIKEGVVMVAHKYTEPIE